MSKLKTLICPEHNKKIGITTDKENLKITFCCKTFQKTTQKYFPKEKDIVKQYFIDMINEELKS